MTAATNDARVALEHLVETLVQAYNHPEMKSMTPDKHFARLSEIYGPNEPSIRNADIEALRGVMDLQAKTIAVLYWKLAQARGYVDE